MEEKQSTPAPVEGGCALASPTSLSDELQPGYGKGWTLMVDLLSKVAVSLIRGERKPIKTASHSSGARIFPVMPEIRRLGGGSYDQS